MLVPIVQMARFFDPLGPLKRWADRQRGHQTCLHNDRKPRMSPEAARRDHRDMLRFMALNALGGMTIGLVVGAALILLDVGGLMGLLGRASNPVLPAFLVVFPLVLLFGAAAAATAIMTMPYETKFRDEDEQPPRKDRG
ncbi:hypothetical protein J2T09_001270 [Neorhizobium huautlense]|uniref:Uncharacterized protein n=1 Tax=Neorhizobium huautlense TaxID=67774 RepID=A0ABT9PQQ5_9HYPH|nr:hypothetical protein [Neorhizobium huautlense]MDP9836526.1 hypothetical protein [Neorhizobium huautlense]